MNLTYVLIDFTRLMRRIPTIIFGVGLPVFFYIIFGASANYADVSVGNGNVNMIVMISMAAYGAATTAVNVGGLAVTESLAGWGRQLGLTPMTQLGYVLNKCVVALWIAAVPAAVIYVIGAASGARAAASGWALSGAVILAIALQFAAYGLCWGLAFKSESGIGAASGSIVVLAFLGNVFVPLSGWLLDVARFTPLYGSIALARYPVSEGWMNSGETVMRDPLWVPLLNMCVWTAIFLGVATLLVRKSRNGR